MEFTQEKVVGEYEENTWIEMQEDEDDDINCLGMFDDPDPFDIFVHKFPRKRKKITTSQGDTDTTDTTDTADMVIVTVEGYKAENGQQLNSTGLTLWRAAPILCNYLVDNRERHVDNKHILELGAGLGLCGILAGALGAASVYMTDGDSPSLQRMRDNVTRNTITNTTAITNSINNTDVPSTPSGSGSGSDSGDASLCAGVVHCRQLRWGQHLAEFKHHCALPTREGCFDVVMGSDIIYTEDILDPLFETVDYLLKKKETCDGHGDGDDKSNSNSNGDNDSGGSNDTDGNDESSRGVFVLAFARRNVKIDDVFATATKHGFQWSVPAGGAEEGCFVFWRRTENGMTA